MSREVSSEHDYVRKGIHLSERRVDLIITASAIVSTEMRTSTHRVGRNVSTSTSVIPIVCDNRSGHIQYVSSAARRQVREGQVERSTICVICTFQSQIQHTI